MLGLKAKREKLVESARKEALVNLKKSIQKVAARECKRQAEFYAHKIESVTVNLWDDYVDGSQTSVYVESDIPNIIRKDIVLFLYTHLQKSERLKVMGIRVDVECSEPFRKYPGLVAKPDAWVTLEPSWSLALYGMREDAEGEVLKIMREAGPYTISGFLAIPGQEQQLKLDFTSAS